MQEVYLDHNATTQMDPRVIAAMLKEMEAPPSNPSSPHALGKKAKGRLMGAREQIASFFQVQPEELIFTSGGTESANLFLRGIKGPIITSQIDHSCLYQTLKHLEGTGIPITYLPVDSYGAPHPSAIESAIQPNTKALVFSAANGETGVKLDVAALAKIAEKHGIPLFLDAVAWIGKEPFPHLPGITAFSFSGHKFHGPKGIGGLIIRSSCKISPLITGGPQELNRRAGTENLPAIMGLAEAFSILASDQPKITQHLLRCQTLLESGLKAKIPDLRINGTGPRIANVSNLLFPKVDGETLFMQMDQAGIFASFASACASGALEPSRVLLQMGLSRKEALSSVRFSYSKWTQEDEIHHVIRTIAKHLSNAD